LVIIHPTDQADGFANVAFFEFVAVVCSHVIVLKVIGYLLLVEEVIRRSITFN
jgi:hypothetical protein